MPNDNQFLTPTYQAPLIAALNAVIRKLMEAPPQETWKAIRTLYTFLPPECTPECKDLFQEITENLTTISQSEVKDPLFRDSELAEQQANYLITMNLNFLEVIKTSLFKHGYLRNDFTIKPRYGNMPEMRVE
jgi:hypothetical protein